MGINVTNWCSLPSQKFWIFLMSEQILFCRRRQVLRLKLWSPCLWGCNLDMLDDLPVFFLLWWQIGKFVFHWESDYCCPACNWSLYWITCQFILHCLNHAPWYTYMRKTNTLHTFLNDLFHLNYPRHVWNKELVIIFLSCQRLDCS
jgi:hypothetical protein